MSSSTTSWSARPARPLRRQQFLTAALLIAAPAAALAVSPVQGFRVNAHLRPKLAYFDGERAVRLTYRFQARGARDVKIDVTRVRRGGNRVVRTWLERGLEPGRHRLSWRGFDRRLRAVDDGRYAFRVGRRGGRMHNAGKVRIRGFIFPVDGSHGTRGEIGSFGAPRVDGRRHMGFDITAGCGTPLRAARAGVVRRAGYDADLYGNYVLINARRSPLNLFYAHMRSPSKAGRGDRVRTGQRIGRVGLTGNADGTPCHLHFEIRVGGRPVDPDPALARWDAWS